MSLYPANSSLIAQAWVGSLNGLSTSMVGTKLPSDNATWGVSGFVVIEVVGGRGDSEISVRRPIVQCECVAVAPGRGKPLWNVAEALAERIMRGCEDEANIRRVLTMPVPASAASNYPQARVLEANWSQLPDRSYGDDGAYARVFVDILLNWVEIS